MAVAQRDAPELEDALAAARHAAAPGNRRRGPRGREAAARAVQLAGAECPTPAGASRSAAPSAPQLLAAPGCIKAYGLGVARLALRSRRKGHAAILFGASKRAKMVSFKRHFAGVKALDMWQAQM